MKMIIAYVQPATASRVVHALHNVHGLTGATFTDVKGFGRGRTKDKPVTEVLYGAAPKVRVEVAVQNDMEEVVIQAIRDAAHTGHRGDGKIYVTDISQAIRISTGEEGETAV